jgi:diguanylate cyclase (GGDEF)-like protein
MRKGRKDRRGPAWVSVATLVLVGVTLPFGHRLVGASVSFVPAVLAAVACFDILSVVLLAWHYYDSGDLRFLATSWAYLWSLVLMGGYALSFPGVLTHPPLAVTASVAPWCYLGWHAGFPILLGVAWAPWPRSVRQVTRRRSRRRVLWASNMLVVAVGCLMVGAVTLWVRHLPVLIHGLSTSPMTRLTAPVVMPLVVISVFAAWWGTRQRQGPETWTWVTALVCACDLTLTYSAHLRYSFGWYIGRTLTVTAAALVLTAMLGEFRRLKSAAELGATTDGLTGLANRRLLEAVLTVELSRASRAGAPTAALVLDLDGFKHVNDVGGHEAGDRILRQAAAAWSSQLRACDVLARTGGDEFAVVLADTGWDSARLVAERLAAVTPREVGVSIGIAIAMGDNDVSSLLQAADRDMYSVKTSKPALARRGVA